MFQFGKVCLDGSLFSKSATMQRLALVAGNNISFIWPAIIIDFNAQIIYEHQTVTAKHQAQLNSNSCGGLASNSISASNLQQMLHAASCLSFNCSIISIFSIFFTACTHLFFIKLNFCCSAFSSVRCALSVSLVAAWLQSLHFFC